MTASIFKAIHNLRQINSFKAQGVNRIYRLPWKEFVPLDQLFADNSFFTGSVNVDDTQVLILDLEHILAEIFPNVLIEDVTQEILNQIDQTCPEGA